MDSITLLRRHFDTISDDSGWPEHGWPTLADAADFHDDARARDLLTLYQEGDHRAGLVCVIICLDALVARARRLGLDAGECVSALWLRLGTYDLLTRSRYVRASLVMDATRDAARMQWVRDLPLELPTQDAVEDDEPDPDDPDPSRIIDVALRTGVLTLDEAAVLHAIHVEHHSQEAVARGMATSRERVLRLCHRAQRRLRRHREDLVAAA